MSLEVSLGPIASVLENLTRQCPIAQCPIIVHVPSAEELSVLR